MTINDALKGRDNNFNLVRFLAAFAVLFDHVSLASLGPGVHKPAFEQMFGMSLSIELILRPIVGGLGTLFGPVIGSFILTPLSEISLAYFAKGGLEGLHLILYGILAILVVLFMPKGIIAYVQRLLKPILNPKGAK